MRRQEQRGAVRALRLWPSGALLVGLLLVAATGCGRTAHDGGAPDARRAEAAVSALAVTPERLRFEASEVGGETATFTVTNTGELPVLLTALEVEAGGVFSVEPEAAFDLSPVTAGQAVRFEVQYLGSDRGAFDSAVRVVGETVRGEHVGRVALEVGSFACLPVDLRCRATQGQVSFVGVGGDGARRYAAEPLSRITCTAALAEGGEPLGLRVTSRAPGSSAGIEREAPGEHSLFLDAVGTYRLAVSGEGVAGPRVPCEAEAEVVVRAGEGLLVQLTWRRPGVDPLQSRDGVDVDLHFLHPNGVWGAAPWDVYYANARPSRWGPTNPELDRDDIFGFGPENISWASPVQGPVYRIGVKYFSSHGLGPAVATVRVFTGGSLEAEFEDLMLERDRQFWDVATVEATPSGIVVTPVLTRYENQDDASRSLP